MFTTQKDFLVILRALVPLWWACRVNCVIPVMEGGTYDYRRFVRSSQQSTRV